jgi:hypothetical protein
MAVKQPNAALHACTIRAASLEYRHEETEDDVVLTTCESLNFGGQVEPTQAELDEYDLVLVRTQALHQQTCACLAVSRALSDVLRQHLALTVSMAVCGTVQFAFATPAGCLCIQSDWLRPPDQALCK